MSYEKALLGTILANPNSYLDVHDLLDHDFEDQRNSVIWRHIAELFDREALSSQAVKEQLRANNLLEEEYIDELLSLDDTAGLKEYHYQIIEASIKRELTKMGRLLALDASDGKTSNEIIEDHIKSLLMLRRTRQHDPMPVGSLLPGFEEAQLKLISGEVSPFWYPPVQAIREIINHMTDVDFQIIVGPTGKGKSSLLRHDAIQTAKQGMKVLTLTLENSEMECMTWGIAQLGRINHYHVDDTRKLSQAERTRYEEKKQEILELPWYVHEMGMCTISDVVNTVKRFKLQHPDLKLIQVDGVYLIRGKGETYENISTNTQILRSLAQEVHVPIVGTTQYNRGINHKNEPEIDDILYAGENPARQIVALTNPPMNQEDAATFPENLSEMGTFVPTKALNATVMKAHILKNTNGPTGVSGDIKWIKPYQAFQTLEHGWKKSKTFTPAPKEEFKKQEKKRESSRSYSKDRQIRDWTK